jgi:hypothetical protein
MKRSVLIGFLVFTILVNSILVLAEGKTSNFQLDGESYDIELNFVSTDTAEFTVNGDTETIGEQSAYPTLYTLSKIGGLDFIAKDTTYQSFVGGRMDVSAWVGIEMNISNGETKNLIINGENYLIEGLTIGSDRFEITINDETEVSSRPVQESPYNFNFQDLQGLDIITKKITYQSFVGGLQQATVIVGKEINFSLVETCENDCFILGERTCEGNGYKICGEYDEDVCRDWSSITNCESDETCTNGVCVSNSEPNPTCTNKCTTLGEKKCSAEDSYEVCGNYNNDECLEWSDSIVCPMGPIGKICEEASGECITGYPDPSREKECEPIGLRENSKYCSNVYEWETQNIDSETCENNFECKSNTCKNEICGEAKVPTDKEDNKWILWILFGGLGLIIVLVIFLLIKNK